MALKSQLHIPLYSSFRRQALVFIFFTIVNLLSVIIFNRFIQPQGYEYEIIARSLLAGTGYSGTFTGGEFGPSSNMTPIYPGLIYLSFKIFGVGNWLPIQLLQVLLLSFVPLILLKIQREMFPNRPALSWGVLLLPAIVPYTMFSAYIGPAAILTLCVTTGFYLFVTAAKRPDWRYFIGLGVLAGITGLIDPVPLLLFVIGFIWLLFQIPLRMINRWIIGGVFALIIVSPWLYRNYRVFGSFPILKNQAGWILWWGNNPLATGGIRNPDGGEYTVVFDALSTEEKDSLLLWNEWQRDQFFMRKALNAIRDWIRTNPIGYLKLKFKSLLYFWFGDAWNFNIQKILILRQADPKLAIFFILTLIPSSLLLLFSITGLIIALRNKEYRVNSVFSLFVLIVWASVYLITHGHTFNRYRVPLDPILLMFSTLGISWLLTLFRHKEIKVNNILPN
jgi:hypothetical protein